MMTPLDGYHSRFDPAKHYDRHLFRTGKGLQDAELNEMQEAANHRIAQLGGVLFGDGDVLRGCEVSIADDGTTVIGGGAVWVRGAVRGVEPGTVTIPTLGTVQLGVYVTETVITELEDPSLVDPSPSGHNYMQPGAARLQVTLAWGWQAGAQTDGQTGEFYPVFGVTNGVLDNKAPPPQLDGVQLALARYDRAATGGTYVSKGLGVQAIEIAAGNQVFSVAEGEAHVDGFEVAKPTATRVLFADDPDLLLIETEPHTYVPTNGAMRVDLVYGPVAELVEVKVTAERTAVTVTHGAYSGAIDALPDTSVLEIVSVSQGGTTYVQGTDYKRTGNSVDWSLAGAEPAPGSSYTVTYRYLTDGTVTDVDDSGFTVSGAVSGTLVNVDYRHKLPRYDRLVMDRDGRITRVRGVADLLAPAVPSVPAGALTLATMHQTWWGLPRVIADAPRVMAVDQLQSLSDQVSALFDLVAQERLRWDVAAREPTAALGVMVDPFLDDDMRDPGMVQDAAVVSGELTLPIAPVFGDVLATDGPHLLSYTLETVVAQDLATGGMKVNPYMAFAPIPPKVTITPAVDRWTETNDVWDGTTSRFIRTGHFVPGVSRAVSSQVTAQSIETIARTETKAEFLRTIPVRIQATNFGPGEIVDRITFDGVEVASDLVADAAGEIDTTIVIPANIPAGSKRVAVTGRATGTGAATFVGQGTVVTSVRRVVQTVEEFHVDPLAQTVMLEDGRHIGGVDLLFRAKGTSQLVVQIREVRLGVPASAIWAEARLDPADVRIDGQPTRFAWDPVWIEAGTEFAVVVLCDDADAEVAIGTLGKFDSTRQQWVTAQPYQVGVLLSSSNNRTWTAHQDSDLWFRLLGCRFTATSQQVPLGSLTADQVSDLVALYNAEKPSADTRITLRLTDPQGRMYALTEGAPANLPQRIDGNVTVQAVLEGTDIRSPVLYPGIQAIFGQLQDAATYVSRAFTCGTNVRVRVVFEAFTPGTSTVTPAVQAGDGSWVDVPLSEGLSVGDGWEEFTHVLDNHTAASTRVRLTLSGSPLNRPRVRRLRVIVV